MAYFNLNTASCSASPERDASEVPAGLVASRRVYSKAGMALIASRVAPRSTGWSPETLNDPTGIATSCPRTLRRSCARSDEYSARESAIVRSENFAVPVVMQVTLHGSRRLEPLVRSVAAQRQRSNVPILKQANPRCFQYIPFKRLQRFAGEAIVPPINWRIAPGWDPVPSTRMMLSQMSSGAYFRTNSLISSSLVPAAIFSIQILIFLSRTHCTWCACAVYGSALPSVQAMMLTPPST
ncbi:hypothetical protein [Variovorax sp. HW608]|uniref:hypothetical protein n=1 Tax=Variovorax sp. HW608 TaxID=1034889 RepID=UPI0012FDF0BB|nr:hypothetical protein [Variovorax sp. HW608]